MSLSNMVVALDAEAKPLIDRYRLKRDHAIHAFKVYRGEELNLIVSASRKLASAAATGFLAGEHAGDECAWLNVGIAGHQHESIGQVCMASKIVDRASARTYFPYIDATLKLPTYTVETVEQAETDYPAPVLYDMEASGFFVAASRVSSLELIRCVKVVSDNQHASVHELDLAQVSDLIEQGLDRIDEVLRSLHSMLISYQAKQSLPESVNVYLSHQAFSQTQRTRLKGLLYRLNALGELPYLEKVGVLTQDNAPQFLNALEAHVTSFELSATKRN